ncbi:short chain dehydrogenase family protein [Mycobacterium kansasii]|uniref:Short chain dehydrogenase family protein n=1 Tax=Mycobacterium kansasii TaxID=1768 RepID=A0A1V3XHE3_MYCKA|nr:short chain dehydrogenase family protein [Mycobacterium kansasii]
MILDRFRLDDQVAVITGGGRGLGAAIALAFAEAGADVVIASRTRSQLDEVAEGVRAIGRRAHVVAADLANPEVTAELAGQTVEAFGRLDIVVNNVGGTMPNMLLTTSTKDLKDAFTFNVATAHALTVAAVPLMLEHSGGGSIINITSTMGRLAGRGFAAYGTAKAALAHYTRLTALDLCPRIRVNAIARGRSSPPHWTWWPPTTNCARRWNGPHRCAGSAIPSTSPPPQCIWPRPRAAS